MLKTIAITSLLLMSTPVLAFNDRLEGPPSKAHLGCLTQDAWDMGIYDLLNGRAEKMKADGMCAALDGGTPVTVLRYVGHHVAILYPDRNGQTYGLYIGRSSLRSYRKPRSARLSR